MTRITADLDDETIAILERMGTKRGTPIDQTLNFLLERMLVGIPHQQPMMLDDYKPQHIPVMIDAREDGIKKHYRCNTCGAIVFNYYGGVKLITNGVYDANQNMVDGEERDWFTDLGVPDEVICGGRVVLQLPDGRTVKRRCSSVYYRIGV